MRKMGWRDGQGVGPRITFEQRKKQANELGVKLAQGDDEEGGEGEASRHYYAPLDRPLATVLEVGIATDRGWGLGYKPTAGIPSSSSTEQTTRGAARMTMDDDDDDDDVYGGSSGPSQGKGGWGVVDIDDGDDGITLLDPTRPKPRQAVRTPLPSSASLSLTHPTFSGRPSRKSQYWIESRFLTERTAFRASRSCMTSCLAPRCEPWSFPFPPTIYSRSTSSQVATSICTSQRLGAESAASVGRGELLDAGQGQGEAARRHRGSPPPAGSQR